jgi:hypothetical protein
VSVERAKLEWRISDTQRGGLKAVSALPHGAEARTGRLARRERGDPARRHDHQGRMRAYWRRVALVVAKRSGVAMGLYTATRMGPTLTTRTAPGIAHASRSNARSGRTTSVRRGNPSA